jgi:collagenase-like PrtC family protease
MKILAPINQPREVEMLVGSGADELYCGVLPREWLDRYSAAVQLNRREEAAGNMQTLAELRELVDLAHKHNAKVHLALNAPTYNEDQIPYVFDLVAEAVDQIGIDALLVADVGLLAALMSWRSDLRVHVSSLAAIHNSQAVGFFADLGASRAILPRQTRMEEAVAMAAAVPEMEIEVFILNDGCIYEEGHCSTLHRAGPICLTDWNYTFRPSGSNPPLTADEIESMQSNVQDYRHWITCHMASGSVLTSTRMPGGPCGLCAIPELSHGGVHSLKIIGREAPAYKKLRSVQQVRHVLDRVAVGLSAEEIRVEAQALRGTPELCRSGYACYYPEVVRDRNL